MYEFYELKKSEPRIILFANSAIFLLVLVSVSVFVFVFGFVFHFRYAYMFVRLLVCFREAVPSPLTQKIEQRYWVNQQYLYRLGFELQLN
jgi:hypothetical protein